MNRKAQQHAGPWLDRLFPIQLHGGRIGTVKGFSVLPSNTGILEGGLDPESNEQQRRKIRALAKDRYGPVVEVEPVIEPLPELSRPGRPRERLPWMACVAQLESKPHDPERLASAVTLVWWQDAFTRPIPEEIERAAACIDWASASD
ncbi:hypothetical protein [Anaeromyxobacter oryzae]|uniref:hypothetical protein n=1 Tax=Anaeromyxobacter oryzae TaxID=2918170 RepID=UPI0020BD64A9|nr:hypothetical protein [Anaeromyxobacter oryzae]